VNVEVDSVGKYIRPITFRPTIIHRSNRGPSLVLSFVAKRIGYISLNLNKLAGTDKDEATSLNRSTRFAIWKVGLTIPSISTTYPPNYSSFRIYIINLQDITGEKTVQRVRVVDMLTFYCHV